MCCTKITDVSFVRLFILFICSFVHFVRLFICSFVHFVHLFVCSFVHLFVCPFVHLLYLPSSYDKMTGYKTKSILCIPVLENNGTNEVKLIGIFQMINKLEGVFSKDDELLMLEFSKFCSNKILIEIPPLTQNNTNGTTTSSKNNIITIIVC